MPTSLPRSSRLPRLPIRRALAGVALGGAAVSAHALTRPAGDAGPPAARLEAALERLRIDNAWTVEAQRSICEIPAPPFKEQRRAAEMQRRFSALGLRNVRIDSVGNAIGERPGSGGPTVVLSGHLDTVFPEGTDVTVRTSGDTMRAPGIGDDCRGLAVVLAVARALEAAKVTTKGTIVFVATVGEEGAGNLRGARHLLTRELAGKVNFFITVDSPGLDLVSRAVGSHRYRVRFSGPGGHSYADFGMPNPVHAMGRAIALIGDLPVPVAPRTTFNVGVVQGGTSVNAIAGEAVMDVDLRSESAAALDALDAGFRHAVDSALVAEQARWPASPVRLRAVVDTIGLRPAGAQPDDAPIVRTALASARTLGFTPRIGAASTDANVAIALGIPALQINGGGSGEGAHSLEEWYTDGARGWLGPQWAAMVAVKLAGER